MLILSSASLARSSAFCLGISAALVGCLQDFDQFKSSGGAATTTTTTSGPSTSTGAVQCTAAAQCEDLNACTTDLCMDGKCSNQPLNGLRPGYVDTSTDCAIENCVNGVATSQPDSDDNPEVDTTDCVVRSCSGVMIVETDVPQQTPCGVGGMTSCDGMGNCVGCITAPDCGADGECFTWICAAGGMCMQMPRAAQDLTTQDPGDCQKRTCDGNNTNPVLVYEVNDPMLDANDCTSDVCMAANMTVHANLNAGVGCNSGGGTVCDGNGACCAPNNACGGGTLCGMLMTNCNTTQNCTCGGATPACVAGMCEQCDGNNDCSSNSNGHACVSGNVCGCNVAGASQCSANQYCNLAMSRCEATKPLGTSCGNDAECQSTHCSGTCAECTIHAHCNNPCRQCNGSQQCVNVATGAAGEPPDPNGFACNGSGSFFSTCSAGNQNNRCVDDTCGNPPSSCNDP